MYSYVYYTYLLEDEKEFKFNSCVYKTTLDNAVSSELSKCNYDGLTCRLVLRGRAVGPAFCANNQTKKISPQQIGPRRNVIWAAITLNHVEINLVKNMSNSFQLFNVCGLFPSNAH